MNALSSLIPVEQALAASHSAGGAPASVQAGYGVSLTDLSGFSDALARADGTLHPHATAPAAETMQALFKPSLALAVQAAHEREMPVIAMTGEGEAADALGSLLLAADTHIAIAHAHAASVLHAQQLALHCICESLDALLLSNE